jgi:predicted NACHT family NTPase
LINSRAIGAKYQTDAKNIMSVAQQWIANDQILQLLDSLDEVEQTDRPICVDVINTYRQEHGFIPMVICCRASDYASLPERLILGTAVMVQPLTMSQIAEYITKSSKDLTAMQIALQTDLGLQEIVSTPLMLNILAYSSQGMSQEAVQTLQSSRYVVLEQYIERLLQKETKQRHPYTPEQIRHWLSWLSW